MAIHATTTTYLAQKFKLVGTDVTVRLIAIRKIVSKTKMAQVPKIVRFG